MQLLIFPPLNEILFIGGTDNHLLVCNVRQGSRNSKGVDGTRVSHVAERVGLLLNDYVVPEDKSEICFSGIRIGTE